MQAKNWTVAWRMISLKDLHGYPLWETELHDILQKTFPELQLIFLHYSGSSMMGAASVQAATKIGMTEMLSFARETQIPTKEFKMEEVQRHFTAANAEAKITASGTYVAACERLARLGVMIVTERGVVTV